jgi:hypothetical protein
MSSHNCFAAMLSIRSLYFLLVNRDYANMIPLQLVPSADKCVS